MYSNLVPVSMAPVAGARSACAVFATAKRFALPALSIVLAFISTAALAQSAYVTPSDEYRKRVDQAGAIALGDNPFGAASSLYSGATEFFAVDIDLPGNNALPVRFGRRFIVEDRKQMGYLSGMDDWDVDVPYIETVASDQGWLVVGYNHPDRFKRCSSGYVPLAGSGLITVEQAWSGYQLHLPGGGDQELMKAIPGAYGAPGDGGTYPWVTAGNVRLSCLNSLHNGTAGEGFQALLPDGTRYRFDWMVERQAPAVRKSGPRMASTALRKRYFLLATRIEDRFGNWVAYAYSGDKLTGITASDGRAISVSYVNGKVSSATAHGRSWSYQYNASGLSTVVQPDGARWIYEKTGSLISNKPGDPSVLVGESWEPQCQEADSALLGPFRMVVTHPSGARGDFQFGLARHYRSSVPWTCYWEYMPNDFIDIPDEHTENEALQELARLLALGYSFEDAVRIVEGSLEALEMARPDGLLLTHTPGQDDLRIPNYFDTLSLISKAISGPGLAQQVTTYNYGEVSPLGFCYTLPCVDQEEAKWVTVTLPDGSKDKYRYGVQYGVNEGQLLSVARTKADDSVLSQAQTVYVADAAIAQQPFPDRIGETLRDVPMLAKVRPVSAETTTQDGVTYTRTVHAFDALARPTSVTRASTIGYGYSRSDGIAYHDNLSKWVLGQTASVSTGNTVPAQTTFDPVTALPLDSYEFGIRKQRLSYNADGTVATVTDANNHVTTLSNWKRGIPQTIQHPATAESPSGSTESAVVNDSGWITATTDENGYTTTYGHDAMGRVSSITHPTGDSVDWYPTTRTFERVDTPELGLPAGHWRQTVSTGNARHYTYYDALWRPVASESYDATDFANTRTQTFQRYDLAGRPAFASYPVADGSDFQQAVAGTYTDYDALGRPVRVRQSSELGTLSTSTEYLTGGEIKVTNPRGQSTRTRYAAWDQPSTDYPIEIFHPEGAVTQIWRDAFFQPTQLRRSGPYAGQTVEAVRKYYYDGAHRLCRTDEPETGSTVMGLDDAGNLVWSAAGLSGLNNTDCDHVAAYNGGRTVTRSYDARHRLTALNFPDGLGNQVWTYTKDGLPAQVTTYNGAGNTLPVINAYHYNKRRLLGGQGETVGQTNWYTWALGYGYDRHGSLATHSYPTGLTVAYAPNALGQPTQAGSYATGVKYHPNGAISRFTYGNGVVHAMSQNLRQLPQVVSDVGVAGYTYSYDANGNPTRIDDNAQGASFNRYLDYDGLDRLTRASSAMFGGSLHRIDYAYDPLDNLRAVTHAGVREHNYWYNGKNQLTNVLNTAGASVVGLDYDEQGNLKQKNSQTYGFDFGNRLRWVTGKETYRYDALGRRVETVQDDGTLRLFQYSQAGQYLFGWKKTPAGAETTTENVYLGGSLVATIDHNWPSNTVIATKYQHTDALGSPVAVTDASGALIERTNYEPYGSAINKTVDGIGYTGHVMDGATGLTYMQQRYYDSTVGRFLSVDPVAANSGTGSNFNRYKYAGGNPYRYFDPDGRNDREVALGLSFLLKAQKEISLLPISIILGADLNYTAPTGSGELGGVHPELMLLGSSSAAPRSARAASQIAMNPAVTKPQLLLSGPRQIEAAWGVNTYRHGGLMSGIEHIFYRHGAQSAFKNVSKFSQGTKVKDVVGYVDRALRYGKAVNTGPGAYTVEYNIGRTIGSDVAGNAASNIRVHVRDGIIQTAFPF